MADEKDKFLQNWQTVITDLRSTGKLAAWVNKQKESGKNIAKWTSFDVANVIKFIRDAQEEVHLFLMGPKRVGKSALCNALLGDPNLNVPINHGMKRETIDKSFTSKKLSIHDNAGIKWEESTIKKWLKNHASFKSGLRIVFVLMSSKGITEGDVLTTYVNTIDYLLKHGAVVFFVNTAIASSYEDQALEHLVDEQEGIMKKVFNQQIKGQNVQLEEEEVIYGFGNVKVKQWKCKELNLYGCSVDSYKPYGIDELFKLLREHLDAFSILELFNNRGDIDLKTFNMCASSLAIELARLIAGPVLADKAGTDLFNEYAEHYNLLMKETNEQWMEKMKAHPITRIYEHFHNKETNQNSTNQSSDNCAVTVKLESILPEDEVSITPAPNYQDSPKSSSSD